MSRNLDKKVILVCAGPGYGKTTLLSHFLSGSSIPIVYYHLEKTDAEPVVFFSYLVAGIQRLRPSFGQKIGDLRHLFNHPQRYLEIIVGTFINEVVEKIKAHTYIILEDYHTLHPSGIIDKFLDYLFSHMPANLHFIITARSKPDFSLTLMQARNEVFELTNQQLRFTKEEIRNLFKRTYSLSLRPKEIDWVTQYSEGWPVSLRLMLQSTSYLEGIRSSDQARTLVGGYLKSQVSLFNYFAQEIYFHEKPRIRDFLRDCSVFEWLTPGLCDAVTGRRNSIRLLADLARRNAFIVRIPEHGYRFHNLFRDFLYSKLTDSKRQKAIYLRAAKHFSKKRKYDDALLFYSKARSYRPMISIINKVGSMYIAQGRSVTLCNYIEQVSASIRNRALDLLIIYSQALNMLGKLDQARQGGLKAMRILKKRSGAGRKQADVLYTLGGINYTQGKFKAAMRYYMDALKLCPRGSNLTRASILNSLGSLYTFLGGKYLGRAVQFFEPALHIAQRRKYPEIEASILNNWAMSEWKAGNLKGAYARLSKIPNILAKHFSPGCGAGFFNAARLSIRLGHTSEAKSVLDLGAKTCSAYNDRWSMVALWSGYGLLYQEAKDLVKARHYVCKSLQLAERLGVDRLTVMAMHEMCKINLADGDYVESEKCISSMWSLKKTRDDADSIPIHLTEAMAKMAQERLDDAEKVLAEALHLAEKFGEIFQQFLIDIELARLSHLKNDEGRTCEFLSYAIGISQDKGYDYLLLKKLQREKWMLRKILARDIRQEYVKAIIKKSDLDIHWVDAFLFGVPRVLLDDRPIDDKVWQTLKTKKLFFYLILYKGEKVTGDRLIDTLWPEVPREKGSGSLRKAIQYIRDATRKSLRMEGDLLCSAKGAYQIVSDTPIDLDTDEFEFLLSGVKEAQDEIERRRLLERAVSIYKDGFASGWYDDWVEEMRLYYQRKYEECLVALADVYDSTGNHLDALNVCRKLIALNLLDETHYCRLMKTLAQLGRYNEIEQVFMELKKSLKKELRAKPRTETLEVYHTLMSKTPDK